MPNNLYTKLEIIDLNPLECMVVADGRRGSIRLILRGKLPEHLNVYASEMHSDPNEHNSSWIIKQPPRVLYFKMSDSKSA